MRPRFTVHRYGYLVLVWYSHSQLPTLLLYSSNHHKSVHVFAADEARCTFIMEAKCLQLRLFASWGITERC
jgi:hypothetical protein